MTITEMTNEQILMLSASELLDREMLLDVYDVEELSERERLLGVIMLRASQLGIEPMMKRTIRAFDKDNKALENSFNRAKKQNGLLIPLKLDNKGAVMNTQENYEIILRNDEKFKGLQYNLLTDCPEKIANGVVMRWTDADDSETRGYIEKNYSIHSQQKLDDAMRVVFRERSYHPIKDIIEAVEWDGTERIATFLPKWMKCGDTPYTREVSRLIFAGGINRLYHPGCKFDDVPVLIGTKQGEGKSTFVRWLALKDKFFAEVTEIEGQKGIEALEGAWICEVAELLALTKAKEVEAVKSYMTKINDRYRKPFDRRVTEHPRQCVFVGTTNKEQFLTDKTGNRRFYPIKVNQSGYSLFNHEEEIKADIIQCWAEAKAKLDTEEMKPFADVRLIDEIRQHQAEAVEDDYRVGLIEVYLEDGEKTETCVLDLWKNAMHEFGNPKKKDSNEIALILQTFPNWEKQPKVKRFGEYGVTKWWRRVDEKAAEIDNLIDGLPF